MTDKTNREDVLKEVKRICNRYARNKQEISNSEAEIKRLEMLKVNCSDKNFLTMIDESIQIQKNQSEQCLREVLFFECSVSKLEDRTRFIMRQLYDEEISWDFVKNRKGKILSRDTIARERKKGLNLMADEYLRFSFINQDNV